MHDRPLTLESPDVQAQAPALAIGLSRVGVTGVEKVIRISQHGVEQLFWAKLDCFVDLAGDQINARYFAGRSDGLAVTGGGHLLSAEIL